MKYSLSHLIIDHYVDDEKARSFCDNFLNGGGQKYIFGRNEYAESIAQVVDVDGFIDDFTNEVTFCGKPVLKIADVPQNAIVVSAVVLGRPLTANQRLAEHGIPHLDYFAFRRYSRLNIAPVLFLNEFRQEFELHQDRYDWIYGLLSDDESKRALNKIINFRLSNDLHYMEGFTDIQFRQYFEDFLALKPVGEVFVDVGCFDGYTSSEFIKRCPDYAAIHVFEPEPGNMTVVKEKLAGHERVNYHLYGLSNCAQTLRFQSQGSASRISEQGDIEIKVARLDDLLHEPFTFLKMDIEGGEMAALEGARLAIEKHHPRLAISVYHRVDDLWKIPERILSYRDDYRIYLRHYTEGVTETVIFFIPQESH